MLLQTPQDLLTFKLQTIRDAETQASQALQAQLQLVRNEDLRQLLERRLQQGQQLLGVVSRGIEALGGQGAEDQNRAARGLIEQTAHAVELAQGPEMKQALLIAGVQELEHYCFSAWGTTKSLALELGQEEIADAMQGALDDGHALDRELSALAEGWVNPTAIEQAGTGDAD
jgi:ferritin-like metal-binding protein YciE